MRLDVFILSVALSASVARAAGPGRALVPRISAPAVGRPIPKYINGINLSLRHQPLFASHLMASMNRLAGRIDTGDPASVEILEAEVLGKGPGPKSLSSLKGTLGSEPLPPDQAAALLLVNALAVPDQFPGVLGRLDQMKPGLGRRVSESLRVLGVSLEPSPIGSIYTSNGRLDSLFSGEQVPEDNPLRP